MIHVQILRYLPIAGFAFVMMWLLVKKWDFIKGALSDGGNPSATRTGGMILILVVAINELYTTLKTQEFKYDHLVAILVSIGILFGFIKVVDLFSIWKGGKPAPTDPQKTEQ